jgi:hypothetical protein
MVTRSFCVLVALLVWLITFIVFFGLVAGGQTAATEAKAGTLIDTPTATITPEPATSTPTSTPRLTATPCPMSFSDVQPSDYFYEGVRYLYCDGAISGYSDGTFRPYNNVTRAQICKIIVLANHWPINTEGGPHFTDVLPDNPFYIYIETAYHQGVISGYAGGIFHPGSDLTRGQLCKVIVLAQHWPIISEAPHFIDVPTTHPFYGFIETMVNVGVISGYSDFTFRPGNPATRGQISKVVYLAVTQPSLRQ